MKSLAFLLALLIAWPAQAQHRWTSDHVGTFGGRSVAYVADVAETVLADDEGTPTASVYTTAYIAKDAAATRPVVFAFNGGPGSPSLWLNMGLLGPKRVPMPIDLAKPVDPATLLVDNPATVLDVADIVLIDPPGTGFSRILPGAAPRAFYSVNGDAAAVGTVITKWLAEHNRQGAPVYILGESYGTIRAAAVARLLAKQPQVHLTGVVIMGQALNIIETSQRPMNIVSHAVSLPTLTAIAWYHHRLPGKPRPLAEAVAESEAFANGDYLTALAKGNAIAPADRDRIAARLASLTGIPAVYFVAHNLFILKEDFRVELLKDKGLVVGRYDGRYTMSKGADGRVPDPTDAVTAAYSAQLLPYLRNELKVDLSDEYRLRDTANRSGDWTYGASTSPFSDWPFGAWLADAMKMAPGMRLMIGTGLYDTTTTIGAADHLVAHTDFPHDRVTTRRYEGGHMAYTNPEALDRITADLRAFIRAGIAK